MSFNRAISVLVLLSVTALTCNAQNKKSESQKPLRSSSPKFSDYRTRDSKSDADLDDAAKEKEKDPGKALDKVQDALAESIAQSNTFNEGRSYLLLGDINAQLLEWKLAVQN